MIKQIIDAIIGISIEVGALLFTMLIALAISWIFTI